jgi:nitroreductase
MTLEACIVSARIADHPIEPMFLRRWSPRAFSGAPVKEADLLTIMEAGRWAPSAFNSQPWRYVYALRHDEHWDMFLGLLIDFNRLWAEQAGALIVVASKRHMPPRPGRDPLPSYSHSFDAGASWSMMALQASVMGLYAHGMTGFDMERAAERLHIPPDEYRVEAAVAIGHLGDSSNLPEPLRSRELPSDREPLLNLAFKGRLP